MSRRVVCAERGWTVRVAGAGSRRERRPPRTMAERWRGEVEPLCATPAVTSWWSTPSSAPGSTGRLPADAVAPGARAASARPNGWWRWTCRAASPATPAGRSRAAPSAPGSPSPSTGASRPMCCSRAAALCGEVVVADIGLGRRVGAPVGERPRSCGSGAFPGRRRRPQACARPAVWWSAARRGAPGRRGWRRGPGCGSARGWSPCLAAGRFGGQRRPSRGGDARAVRHRAGSRGARQPTPRPR